MKSLVPQMFGFACAALAAFTQVVTGAPGDVDLSFGSGVGPNGTVNKMAVQSDGKIIIAGQFSRVKGLLRTNLARLNADGSGDPTFPAVDIGSSPLLARHIYTLAVQPDGKVLIGGNFTNVNGIGRNGLARLHGNGSVDTDFHPDTGQASILRLQLDGKVLVGFSEDGGVNQSVIRLNADGSVDPSFNLAAPVPGSLLALGPEGQVLLVGRMSYNQFTGLYRHTLVRLLPNGSVDPSFASTLDVSGIVGAAAFQAGGKAVIAGSFNSINGVPRGHVARLNANGSLDPTFDPGTTVTRESFDGESAVWSLAVRPDGKVLVGGSIKIKDADDRLFRRGFLIGLGVNGGEDLTFARTMANSRVDSVVLQPDGKVLLGGSFGLVNDITRNYFARFHPDGSLDSTLNTESAPNGAVATVVLQPDGKAILRGSFTSVGGGTNKSLKRVQPDGSLDASFNLKIPESEGKFSAVALQSDGKVLVGDGDDIHRFESDGTLDATFNAGSGADDTVTAFALQPDGKILVGGGFYNLNGTARRAIARLNADGSVDPTFGPGTGADDFVVSIVLQPDGRILIGGNFTSVNGTSRNGIARLHANGSLDMAFDPGTGIGADIFPYVSSLAQQADGKVLIVGKFITFNGSTRKGIARLNTNGGLDISFNPAIGTNGHLYISSLAVQPDGKILIVGNFTEIDGVHRVGVARLNVNGSVDNTFDAGDGTGASCLALQPDGKLLVGGQFTSFNGAPRASVVRLFAQPANEVSVGRLSVVAGLMGFDIGSVTPRNVIVESSTNLLDWTRIQTIAIATDPVRFSDMNHSNFPSRFYRVWWQP